MGCNCAGKGKVTEGGSGSWSYQVVGRSGELLGTFANVMEARTKVRESPGSFVKSVRK